MTGKELRHQREVLGLSQRALADWLGVYRGTVSTWERQPDRAVPAYAARLVALRALLLDMQP